MKREAGTTTVEFAVLATAFFLIVLATIEFSRVLFTWNLLSAVTQRAARVAVVCPPNDPAVKRVALFDGPDGDGALLPELSSANLSVLYLDDQFNDTGGAFPIRFVQASIVDYRHPLAIPFVQDSWLRSPSFSTTLPSESLGYNPVSGARSCIYS